MYNHAVECEDQYTHPVSDLTNISVVKPKYEKSRKFRSGPGWWWCCCGGGVGGGVGVGVGGRGIAVLLDMLEHVWTIWADVWEKISGFVLCCHIFSNYLVY